MKKHKPPTPSPPPPPKKKKKKKGGGGTVGNMTSVSNFTKRRRGKSDF